MFLISLFKEGAGNGYLWARLKATPRKFSLELIKFCSWKLKTLYP